MERPGGNFLFPSSEGDIFIPNKKLNSPTDGLEDYLIKRERETHRVAHNRAVCMCLRVCVMICSPRQNLPSQFLWMFGSQEMCVRMGWWWSQD